jgi:GTPase SAR1 family protein
LKALEPNNTSHMIALCGIGGVGKTTMMQRLKKVAKENKMFNYMVEVVLNCYSTSYSGLNLCMEISL